MNLRYFEDAGVIGFFSAQFGGILEVIGRFTLFKDVWYFRGVYRSFRVFTVNIRNITIVII